MFDVLGELIQAAVTGGTWRALLPLGASLPVAGLAYVLIPEALGRTWIAGGVVVLGAVTGLVWEWKCGDRGNQHPDRGSKA